MSNGPDFTIDPQAFGKLLSHGSSSQSSNNTAPKASGGIFSTAQNMHNRMNYKIANDHERNMQSDRLRHDTTKFIARGFKDEAKADSHSSSHFSHNNSGNIDIGSFPIVTGIDPGTFVDSYKANHSNPHYQRYKNDFIKKQVDKSMSKKMKNLMWFDDDKINRLRDKEFKKAAKKYDRINKKHTKAKRKKSNKNQKYEHEKYMLNKQNDHDLKLLDKLLSYDKDMQKKGKKPSSQVAKFYDNFYKRRHSVKIYKKR